MEAVVREVLSRNAGLTVDAMTVDANADLFAAGMTSHASVGVMLGIEDELDVEFPDQLMRKSTFTSVASILSAVEELAPDSP